MKLGLLDIESAPHSAYVWGTGPQHIAHDHLKDTGSILCWSFKFHGSSDILFASEWDDGKESMLMQAHNLLEECDAVVHYYGSKFDVPMLNREFTKIGLAPPAPYKQIDLKHIVARQFRFASNKLDHVCYALGFGKKIKTDFALWVRCMEGDRDAQKEMETYNRHDVVLLEKLYDWLLPWIDKHPNVGIHDGTTGLACPNCGSHKLTLQGWRVARTMKYQRYQCQNCGTWSRSNRSDADSRGTERALSIVD